MGLFLWALASGWVLGLSAAAPLGPTGLEAIRRAVRRGFWQGFLVGAGATAVDTLYLALVNLGLGTFVISHGPIGRGAWMIGAMVLGYLGVRSVSGALRPGGGGAPPPAVPAGAGGTAPVSPVTAAAGPLLAGALITGTNPVTMGLWLAVGATSMASWQARGTALRWAYTGGIVAGLLSWFVILAGIAARAGGWLSSDRRRWAEGVAGLVLLAFALYFARRAWI